ncbi:MAG: hypothetical protein JETT_2135 [Candidatus Jettenia ecosi]|uniref:Uncharacterized protein n=1 Tax=Candidatus Jettenia ecosi TaxID=2494326 RepID=A0A533QB25_9BACT|nr:MAG: hypothetical protein JETT_2135 [Candidatus Jettenia ecosi]
MEFKKDAENGNKASHGIKVIRGKQALMVGVLCPFYAPDIKG